LRQPDASIPTLCGDPHQAKAAYRFLGSRYVNHDALLSGHLDATFARCAEQDVVLFVQDSTYGDYSHHPATKGLGLIGNGDGRGLCIHSTLAVAWRGIEDFDVLGVADQQVWIRKGRKGKRSSYRAQA
jgi:Transposase DNA-binding